MNNVEKQSEWKNREVGALWKKASANGKGSYCTGYIVSNELGAEVRQRVIMFANKTKNNDKSPDFIIYLSNEQTNNDVKKSPAKTNSAPPKKTAQTVAASVEDDDGVPM